MKAPGALEGTKGAAEEAGINAAAELAGTNAGLGLDPCGYAGKPWSLAGKPAKPMASNAGLGWLACSPCTTLCTWSPKTAMLLEGSNKAAESGPARTATPL